MEREEKGLSLELIRRFPHMRAIHYNGGKARAVCELKKRDVSGGSDKCEQLESSVLTTSIFTNEGWQVTEFNPEPLKECVDCPVSKTSPCQQEDIEATPLTLQTLKGERGQ